MNLKTKEKVIVSFISGTIIAILYFIALKIIYKTYGYDIESKPLLNVLIWLIIYFAIYKLFFGFKKEKNS